MGKFFDLFKDHRTPAERAEAELRKSNKLAKKDGPRSPSHQSHDEERRHRESMARRETQEMFDMMANTSISSRSTPTRSAPFVGGFQSKPSSAPNNHFGGSSSSYASSPSFPIPQISSSPPGPLPIPPQMEIPIPQTHRPSLTMQYATGMLSDSNSPAMLHPQTTYSPPHLPPRPISAPSEPLRQPRLELDADSIPTPLPSPPIIRSNSEPASPVSAAAKGKRLNVRRGSDAAESDTSENDPERCSGMTKANKRCRNKVKTPAALDIVSPDSDEPVPRFCNLHQKEVSTPTGFYATKKENDKERWVKFDKYIPDYLQPSTKAALRAEMAKPRSKSDEPGYIYAFEIRDPDAPGVFQIKVGRSINLNKRIGQWSKQCGSKEQALRGWWPGIADASESSLLKGRIVAGDKGACCHRLERLIHIELGDVTLHEPHYRRADEDSDDDLKAKNKKTRLVRSKVPCDDCGTLHKEIFSFQRPKGGKYVGKEWEKLVKPVLARWGEFCELYV